MAESRWGELGLEENNICDELRPLKLLGRGTFGAVWAAVPCRQQFPKGSGDSVAVKFINVTSFSRQVLAREGYLGRELVVIKLLAADPHANILRSFGAFYDRSFRGESPAATEVGRKLLRTGELNNCRNGLLAIPMDMADFCLRSWLRQRGQDLEAKQCTAACFDFNMMPRCAADICKGVAHMHRLGLMHRDMKPDNVVVFFNPGCGPTLKITDFGSALARASTSPMPCLSQMINILCHNTCAVIVRCSGAPLGGSAIFGERRCLKH